MSHRRSLRIVAASALLLAPMASAPGLGAENLALGRPYTLSVPPSTQWYPLLTERWRKWPDVSSVLTDGQSGGSATWASGRGLDFHGVGMVEVEIDLGEVEPIGRIEASHYARPGAGIRLHQRDEFWVSEDGRGWSKVGVEVNHADASATSVSGLRVGGARFSSGPLRARGRYVLVRSFTHLPGELRLEPHVSIDEISVLRGDVGPAASPASLRATLPRPAHASAYGNEPRDWVERIRKSPLLLELWPQGVSGDDSYHLSVAGTFVMEFRSRQYLSGGISEGVFRLTLPDEIELHDLSGGRARARSRRVATAAGLATRYELQLTDALLRKDGGPVFVVSARGAAPGARLTADWSFAYVLDGRRYESGLRTIELVLEPELRPNAQGSFTAGFWLPYAVRQLGSERDTVERLARFYASLGFDAVNGGQSSPAVRDALAAAGVRNYTGSNLAPNALMFARFHREAWSQVPEEHRFEHHPSSRRSASGICPTRFVESAYDSLREEVARQILATTDHVYENWEPYLFQKSGCVCDACRESFQRFSGWGQERIDAEWPDVVIDEGSAVHDAFTSRQLALVLTTLQRSVDAAAKELGRSGADYVPSIPIDYFQTDSDWRRVHDPAEWLPDLRQVMVWDYGNAVAAAGAGDEQRMGNQLALVPVLADVLGLVRSASVPPRVHFLGAEAHRDVVVLPKDSAFMMVLAFVEGFDGYGAWARGFKPDARFLREQVRALDQIRRHEAAVMGARPATDVVGTIDGALSLGDTVRLRAFDTGNGSRLVAVGNDSLERKHVRLQTMQQAGFALEEEATGERFPSSESDGAVVPLEAKSWRFLTLSAGPADPTGRTEPPAPPR